MTESNSLNNIFFFFQVLKNKVQLEMLQLNSDQKQVKKNHIAYSLVNWPALSQLTLVGQNYLFRKDMRFALQHKTIMEGPFQMSNWKKKYCAILYLRAVVHHCTRLKLTNELLKIREINQLLVFHAINIYLISFSVNLEVK